MPNMVPIIHVYCTDDSAIILPVHVRPIKYDTIDLLPVKVMCIYIVHAPRTQDCFERNIP